MWIYLKWSLLRHNYGQNSLFSLFYIDIEEKSAVFGISRHSFSLLTFSLHLF